MQKYLYYSQLWSTVHSVRHPDGRESFVDRRNICWSHSDACWFSWLLACLRLKPADAFEADPLYSTLPTGLQASCILVSCIGLVLVIGQS